MNTLLRHAPPGRQHPTGIPKMSAPFVRSCPSSLLLPAIGNQAAFQNNSAQNARYLRGYSRR
jgi:hypothetical protein